MASSFNGIPKECVAFLTALDANNDRDWFKARKGEFEDHVLEPARDFVAAMGQRLRDDIPEINAIPRVDKSIFRIHRDTRFSKDKRPYKTHLAIFFWEGQGKKMESPGFYFHLSKDTLHLGGGMYCFTRDQLGVYREAVDDKKTGAALDRIIGDARSVSCDGMMMEDYKRVPKGYPQDHPRAALLRKKGAVLGENLAIPASLHSARAVDYVYRRFEKLFPLHRWLVANI